MAKEHVASGIFVCQCVCIQRSSQSYDLINELLESLVAKKGNVQANLNEVQKDMERLKNDIVNKKNVDKELKDKLHFYQEELKDVTRKQKKAKEDKKFWDDVEVVGVVVNVGVYSSCRGDGDIEGPDIPLSSKAISRLLLQEDLLDDVLETEIIV